MNPNLEDQYRKMFSDIQTETFLKIIDDRSVALKYAEIGLNKMGENKPEQSKIEEHADIMQSVARIILEEREMKGRDKTNTQRN